MENMNKGQPLKQTAAILAIGDELCNGEYQNTNTTDIGKHLNGLGYKVREHAVCADQRHLIARALSRFLSEYDLVVISGGLGPTSDDVTRFSVADAMETKLEFREECWEHIVKRMQSFNLQVREEDRIQAYIPVGATVLQNTRGLACGFMLEKFGTKVAVLPGPPQEMKAMLLDTFKAEPMSAYKAHRFEWKLMGLMETETHVLVGTLGAGFASKVKYLWRYPYLNLSVEVAESDATGLQCVQQLDNFLHQHTVSKNGLSAVELLGAEPEVSWLGDDAELDQLLASLPAKRGAPQFVIETVPKLSQIGSEQSYTGSLEITCSSPGGRKFTIAAPLRGAEVREFVKEFAAWTYLRSTMSLRSRVRCAHYMEEGTRADAAACPCCSS